MTDYACHNLNVNNVKKLNKKSKFEVIKRKIDKKTNKEVEIKSTVDLQRYVLEDKGQKLLDTIVVLNPNHVTLSKVNGTFKGPKRKSRRYKFSQVRNYVVLEEDSVKTFSRSFGRGHISKFGGKSRNKRRHIFNEMDLQLPEHVKIHRLDIRNLSDTYYRKGFMKNIVDIREGRYSILTRPVNHRFIVNCAFSQNIKLNKDFRRSRGAILPYTFTFDFLHYADDKSVYGDCNDYKIEIRKKLEKFLQDKKINLRKFETFGCKPKSIFLQHACGGADGVVRVDFDRNGAFKIDGAVPLKPVKKAEKKRQICDVKIALLKRNNGQDLCINYDNGNQFIINNYYSKAVRANLKFNKVSKDKIFVQGKPFQCYSDVITGSHLVGLPTDDPRPEAVAKRGWKRVCINMKRNVFDFFNFTDKIKDSKGAEGPGKVIKYALYNLPHQVEWIVNDKILTSKELTNLAMDKKNALGLSLLNHDGDKGVLFDPVALQQNVAKPNIKLHFKKAGHVKIAVGCMDNSFQLSKKAVTTIKVLARH
jgi:hypothetical protein